MVQKFQTDNEIRFLKKMELLEDDKKNMEVEHQSQGSRPDFQRWLVERGWDIIEDATSNLFICLSLMLG